MQNSKISVPIPTKLFIELCSFLSDAGSDIDPVDTITDAISYWMENAEWKKEDLMPEVFENEKGYLWKLLFLPHNTSLRMKYKGSYSYAKVKGDEIYFEGNSVSPSEFANSVAGSSRNAWRDVEVNRPTDDKWYSAFLLRDQLAED